MCWSQVLSWDLNVSEHNTWIAKALKAMDQLLVNGMSIDEYGHCHRHGGSKGLFLWCLTIILNFLWRSPNLPSILYIPLHEANKNHSFSMKTGTNSLFFLDWLHSPIIFTISSIILNYFINAISNHMCRIVKIVGTMEMQSQTFHRHRKRLSKVKIL